MSSSTIEIATMAGPDSGFTVQHMDPARLVDLRARAPLLCVLESQDCRALLQRFPDIFRDRSALDASKGLSAVMRLTSGIPVFIGKTYRHAGQTVRSLRTLLRNARREGQESLFIVGLPARLLSDVLRYGPRTARRNDTTPALTADARAWVDLLPPYSDVKGRDKAFAGISTAAERTRRLIMLAARDRRTVLLEGEPGVGKDFVARVIHDVSGAQHFSPQACAVMKLKELKVALNRAGYHAEGPGEPASDITVYLDEVSRLPVAAQVYLRKALERDAEANTARTRARIIASTSLDLCLLAGEGRFDWDLYYRLQEFAIPVPSIAERKEDIPLLAQHVWKTVAGPFAKPLSREVQDLLAHRPWPENVSGLRVVMRRIAQDFGVKNITADHVRAVLAFLGQSTFLTGKALSENRRAVIYRTLREAGGLLHAAQELFNGPKPRRAARHRDLHRRLLRLLEKIQGLCVHPTDFGSETTFAAVSRAAGSLGILATMLQSKPDESAKFWSRQAEPACRTALTAVFEDSRRTLTGAI